MKLIWNVYFDHISSISLTQFLNLGSGFTTSKHRDNVEKQESAGMEITPPDILISKINLLKHGKL